MQKDLSIIFHYQHEDTGALTQRTFKISEIRAGEDVAHLAILRRYYFIGMTYPESKD